MKDNSELTRQQWGNCLYQAAAALGKTPEECSTISDRYDALTATGMGFENAFTIILESQASCNARDVLSQAGRFIHDNLDSMNKFQPKIKLNSKTRLADTIARFNKNVSKLASIEVNGVSLTENEIEALKIPVPANVTTESFASDKSSKVKGLSLEITK